MHAFTHSQKSIYYIGTVCLHKEISVFYIKHVSGGIYDVVLPLIKSTDPSLMSAGFYVCHEGRGCDRALISAITLVATHTHTIT